jgi:hypothetical protein
MHRQHRAAAMRRRTASPPAMGAVRALAAIGAAGLVWLGIREFPALRREIKIWMM